MIKINHKNIVDILDILYIKLIRLKMAHRIGVVKYNVIYQKL